MVSLYCLNPIRSCGVVEHTSGARYWLCSVCGSPNEPLK